MLSHVAMSREVSSEKVPAGMPWAPPDAIWMQVNVSRAWNSKGTPSASPTAAP